MHRQKSIDYKETAVNYYVIYPQSNNNQLQLIYNLHFYG